MIISANPKEFKQLMNQTKTNLKEFKN